MKHLWIMLSLLLFPLSASAQEPATPPPTTHDSFFSVKYYDDSYTDVDEFTIVEYYDYDYKDKDWVWTWCPFKPDDCFKTERSLEGFSGFRIKKDKNGDPIKREKNWHKQYLHIRARCSSDHAHCESIDSPDFDHYSNTECSSFAIHEPTNGQQFHYSGKKKDPPPTDLCSNIQKNKKKGIKRRYAVKIRVLHKNSNNDDTSSQGDLALREICKTTYNKKTKSYQVLKDKMIIGKDGLIEGIDEMNCECVLANDFYADDYLVTNHNPKVPKGIGVNCGLFEKDDQYIINNYGHSLR